MNNYSNDELERLAYINNDTNKSTLLCTIVDLQSKLEDVSDVSEIIAQLPSEDFLEDVMSMLRRINVRGDNKIAIDKVIEELESIQQQANSTEYARSLK